VIRVNAPATLAMRWLIPQLPSFRARHPQVEVRISTAFSNDPVLRGSFDVGIRRSADDRAQFEVLPLLAEQTTVIASPAYLKQRKVRKPADLAQAVWLSTESRPGDWENWLASAGCAELRPAQTLRFDHFFVTLQAVVDGMGLGIGPFPTLDSDLESGRIVTPFPKLISRGSEYFALVPRDSDKPKFLRDFLEWLQGLAG
jgi:DNA-binding transcriptional LysR family regulator